MQLLKITSSAARYERNRLTDRRLFHNLISIVMHIQWKVRNVAGVTCLQQESFQLDMFAEIS